MLELDKIYNMDCLEGMKQIDDDSIDCVIADPPYNIGKDYWDRYKKEDYYKLIEKWIYEFQRLLKDTGSLYLWHNDFPTLAHINISIEDNTDFIFKNQLVWDKYNGNKRLGGFLQGFIEVEGLRNYQKMAEYCLYYTFQDHTGLTKIMGNCIYPVREYIRNDILRAKGKICFKEINTLLGTATSGGGVASAVLSLNKTVPAMITKEHYLKLREWLNKDLRKDYEYLRKDYEYLRKDYEDLRKDYEDLRKDYEDLRFTFNNNKSISSVIPCDLAEDFGHPAQKPVKIYREFILHSVKEKGVVLDPFMGSGTTAVACKQTKRHFIGFEIDKKYYDIALKRFDNTPIDLWNYDEQIKLDKYQT